jgi:hypothetical protein
MVVTVGAVDGDKKSSTLAVKKPVTSLIIKHVDFEENHIVKLGRPIRRHVFLMIFQCRCSKIT